MFTLACNGTPKKGCASWISIFVNKGVRCLWKFLSTWWDARDNFIWFPHDIKYETSISYTCHLYSTILKQEGRTSHSNHWRWNRSMKMDPKDRFHLFFYILRPWHTTQPQKKCNQVWQTLLNTVTSACIHIQILDTGNRIEDAENVFWHGCEMEAHKCEIS